MSKKAVLFGVVLIASGLALLLLGMPFPIDDAPLQPLPDATNTPPGVSSVSQSADELREETQAADPVIGAGTEGLFSSVKWRDPERSIYEKYPKTYAELRVLAEAGDVDATRLLTALLQRCTRAALPMSEAELSAIVAQMRATYSYPMLRDGKWEFILTATGELSHKMSPKEFESFVDQWHSDVMKCNVVTVDQREESDYWLGHLEALGGVTVSRHEAIRGMDDDAKLAYIDEMWATGDPSALVAYSDFYGDHELQLKDPSARVKSYAYIYAFYEALIETARYHSDAERLARFREGLKHVHKNYSDMLSEYELKEAHELARQTIERNENCCVRLPPNSY